MICSARLAARLLKLNHERYEEEVRMGLRQKKTKDGRRSARRSDEGPHFGQHAGRVCGAPAPGIGIGGPGRDLGGPGGIGLVPG